MLNSIILTATNSDMRCRLWALSLILTSLLHTLIFDRRVFLFRISNNAMVIQSHKDFFLIGRIFITWKNHKKQNKRKIGKTKTRNSFNYVQRHKINQLSSFTTNYIQECIKKKFTLLNLSAHHTVKTVQLIY